MFLTWTSSSHSCLTRASDKLGFALLEAKDLWWTKYQHFIFLKETKGERESSQAHSQYLHQDQHTSPPFSVDYFSEQRNLMFRILPKTACGCPCFLHPSVSEGWCASIYELAPLARRASTAEPSHVGSNCTVCTPAPFCHQPPQSCPNTFKCPRWKDFLFTSFTQEVN